MPSLQNAAPGSKSMKFQTLDPFAPFLAPYEDNYDPLEDSRNSQPPVIAAQHDDQRIRSAQQQQQLVTQQQYQQQRQMAVQQEKYGEDDVDHLTSKLQSMEPMTKEMIKQRDNDDNDKDDASNNNDDDDDDDEFDSDFDEEFDDDDVALEAFRQRRLKELQQQSNNNSQQQLNRGDFVRTISEDQFLPECTKSSTPYVVIHFFHSQFERCKIMDHHLNIISKKYADVKFLRINAEKAPFFVVKLKVQTLPTILVFEHGETIARLVGFEGLASMAKPDDFKTKKLELWFAKTARILKYIPNDNDEESDDDDDDEDEAQSKSRSRLQGTIFQNRVKYDEDM